MNAVKQFNIPKKLVMNAFKAVKANAGSAGVDRQSIEGFEEDLKGNLYKIWNRMKCDVHKFYTCGEYGSSESHAAEDQANQY